MSKVDEVVARVRANEARWDRFTLEDCDWRLLLDEIERLRAERRRLIDLMSLCTAWFEEHNQNGLTASMDKV